MSDEYEVIEYKPEPHALSLGALPTTGPVALIQQASEIATELAKIIKNRKMTSTIRRKEFVHVEGWSTMGAMLGVLPREMPEQTRRLEDGSYVAVVELIRISDGAVIGRASSVCGMDEKDSKGKLTWANRPEYARRSMAVTRATGKAFRLGFSWIMALAGYEPTPAEEMLDTGEQPPPKKATRKAAKKPAKKPTTTTTNGNGKKKGFSLSPEAMDALITGDNPLADGPQNAMAMVNLSTVLNKDSTPEEVFAWATIYRAARDEGAGTDKAAKQADAQVSVEVKEEGSDG